MLSDINKKPHIMHKDFVILYNNICRYRYTEFLVQNRSQIKARSSCKQVPI